MRLRWLLALTILLSPWHAAVAGKTPAANQTQPTSSTVTPGSSSSATQNAVVAGSSATIAGTKITVDSVSPQGVISMTIEVTDSQSGQPMTLRGGTAQISSDGMVTVKFPDGAAITFNPSIFM